MMSASEVY